MAEEQQVVLGFVEPFDPDDSEDDPSVVDLPNFESKVGGLPQWLIPRDIPGSQELLCTCGKPRLFLLQLYCPLEGVDAAHHRFLYLFVCPSAACWNEGQPVAVLRCQLPAENDYYPADLEERLQMSVVKPDLCALCGARAPHRCGQCHSRRYCCRTHQTAHWRAHKQACGSDQPDPPLSKPFLFPVMEIVSEMEVIEEQVPIATAEDGAVQPFQMEKDQYDKMDQEVAARIQLDKTMMRFQERIRTERSQVLRYCRGAAQPLWVYDEGKLEDFQSQLKCARCQGPVVFEFQVLPQLLFYLDADEGMDWGTIVIFTCENNCTSALPYATEICYVQRPV